MTRKLYPFNFLFLYFYCASLLVRTTCFLLPSSLTFRQRRAYSDNCILHVENKRRKNKLTMAELIEKAQRNPHLLVQQQTRTKKQQGRRRTRKRVDAPQQEYVYASQRRRRQQQQQQASSEGNATISNHPNIVLVQAREFGLVNAAAQHTDALVDTVEPEILGTIRVSDDEETSAAGSLAYVIRKPVGWSILGSGGKKKTSKQPAKSESSQDSDKRITKNAFIEEENDDSADILGYDENELLELLTPEEREQYEQEVNGNRKVSDSGVQKEDNHDDDEQNEITMITNKNNKNTIKRIKIQDEDGSTDILEYDERDIVALLTPEEIEEYNAEHGVEQSIDSKNVQKIQARSNDASDQACFASPTRPSIVSWLKDLKAAQGTPIRGGKYWTALAGATNVDDTGLVVICPKDKVDNVFVDYAKYVAVVGNGKFLAPKTKTRDIVIPKESIKMDTVSKLRKGRADDVVLTVGVTVVEHQSTCTSLVQPCQSQFLDGIRGDATGNPLEKRASRRLLHCNALSISSLVHDDTANVELEVLPDDIAILAERRNKHQFVDGSFLGRDELRDNPLTTAYREINGAADGFQGWTVDRYDKWLFVQHDDKCYKGPLPSIHDGSTAGVYYLPSNPNRSAMGSKKDARPILSEGQPAPDTVPILENGVTYHVSLDKDLSTGIFLDQRPQRAWLTQNCNNETRVLNCFAHCGAFSVAAATAGASTVSLDLNKKWLDRIEPQLKANGIEFDDKHDCIYGDCFDWLARLAKRGEKYDIVILDPPSASVGRTKKRWSVKNDMASLVELAAPLVKKGGVLWTTTNSASIHPVKFARMCQAGLENAGLKSAKLERVAPMPVDFLSIGPQPVKNLVWRI